MSGPKPARIRPESIPVTLLTGFLGAGKATLLNRILARRKAGDIALVINEFGLVPVDHDLVVAGREQATVTTAGCICCTAGSDIRSSLDELLHLRRSGAPAFSHVVVETTGLAGSAPIINSLIPGGAPAVALRDHATARAFHLANVVTVVDVGRIGVIARQFPEAFRQIAFADRVVLTHSEGEDTTQASLAMKLINPSLAIEGSAAPDFDPAALLAAGSYSDLGKGEDILRWLEAEEGHSHSHRLDDLNRHGAVKAIPLVREAPIEEAALRGFLLRLVGTPDNGLLRVKGLVAVPGRAGPAVVHAVGHNLHPTRFLERWPEGAAGTRLVVVVTALDEAALRREFDALPGPDALPLPGSLAGSLGGLVRRMAPAGWQS